MKHVLEDLDGVLEEMKLSNSYLKDELEAARAENRRLCRENERLEELLGEKKSAQEMAEEGTEAWKS